MSSSSPVTSPRAGHTPSSAPLSSSQSKAPSITQPPSNTHSSLAGTSDSSSRSGPFDCLARFFENLFKAIREGFSKLFSCFSKQKDTPPVATSQDLPTLELPPPQKPNRALDVKDETKHPQQPPTQQSSPRPSSVTSSHQLGPVNALQDVEKTPLVDSVTIVAAPVSKEDLKQQIPPQPTAKEELPASPVTTAVVTPAPAEPTPQTQVQVTTPAPAAAAAAAAASLQANSLSSKQSVAPVTTAVVTPTPAGPTPQIQVQVTTPASAAAAAAPSLQANPLSSKQAAPPQMPPLRFKDAYGSKLVRNWLNDLLQENRFPCRVMLGCKMYHGGPKRKLYGQEYEHTTEVTLQFIAKDPDELRRKVFEDVDQWEESALCSKHHPLLIAQSHSKYPITRQEFVAFAVRAESIGNEIRFSSIGPSVFFNLNHTDDQQKIIPENTRAACQLPFDEFERGYHDRKGLRSILKDSLRQMFNPKTGELLEIPNPHRNITTIPKDS